jgi:hypothetical protein
MLKVVRGEPTPEELAALITVVAAKASAVSAVEAPAVPSRWNSPATLLRQPLRPEVGAWQWSARG